MKNKICIALVGPSGSGKSSIMDGVKGFYPEFKRIKSYTTRPQRFENEDEYEFVSVETFKTLSEAGFFLETEVVFGNLYGTPNSVLNSPYLIATIDIKGLKKMKKILNVISILVLPPSFKELSNRLTIRGEKQNKTRLSRAKEEIEESLGCDFVVVNDRIEECSARVIEIIKHQILKIKSIDIGKEILREISEI